MASYFGGNINPAMAAWFAARGPGHHYGGGPGDVGFGPGVLPDFAASQFTPFQQASVQAVASNPNLIHGQQSTPIPQWQIDAQYPGGSGWVPGVTPMPAGWQDVTAKPMTAPRLIGPPIHQGGGGPGFEGGPVSQGTGYPRLPKDRSEQRRRLAGKLFGDGFTRGKL